MTPSQAIAEIRMFIDLYNFGSEACKKVIQAIEDGHHDPKPAKEVKPKVVSTND